MTIKSRLKQAAATVLLTALCSHAGFASERISLDGLWRFKADYYNAGTQQGWFSPALDDSSWDTMNVPGNWDIRNEYAGFAGRGWYRTSFDTPEGTAGKTLLLTFEAVHIDYAVWLNGKLLGEITGGFFPETFDITGKTEPGGRNQLTVAVDNSFRSGAYWNWGGIRRPVWIEQVSPLRLGKMKVTAIPDLQAGTARIAVGTDIIGDMVEEAEVSVVFSLFSEGKRLAHKAYKIRAGSQKPAAPGHTFTLAAGDTRFWHFDRPHLYECRAELIRDGECIHSESVKTGIRKVEVSGGAFLLNGEPVRTAGLNWVADHRFSGNTLPDDLYRSDIDMMRSAGAVMARLSHLPLPSAVYEYMDSVGMMVIDEIPIWGQSVLVKWDSPQAMEWLGKMVNHHYNHPCIVGWSVGNEYGNVAKNPESIEYTREAVEFVKSLDANRVVVEVSNSSHRQENDPTQFSDIACLNVYTSGWGAKADITHSRHPEKPLYISEYGRDLLPEEVDAAREDFADILSEFRARPWIFGFSLWTYNDYRSSWSSGKPDWETPPSGNRPWGIVDACRNPKRAYYNIRREYSPVKSMIALPPAPDNTCRVIITPRAKGDIPAYVMEGYSIVCERLGPDGNALSAASSPLPRIAPGDRELAVKVATGGEAAALRLSLSNPQGYRLADTTLYFAAPPTPVIKGIFSSGNALRIVYDKTPLADEYILEHVSSAGEKAFSEPAAAWYAEQTGLKPGIYTVRLAAANSFGMNYSESIVVTLESGAILPPVILGTASNFGGINIAYGSEKTDYAYTVEYTDRQGTVRAVQTTLKGACFIPGLEKGDYSVRIKRIDQENISSPWSETRAVSIE